MVPLLIETLVVPSLVAIVKLLPVWSTLRSEPTSVTESFCTLVSLTELAITVGLYADASISPLNAIVSPILIARKAAVLTASGTKCVEPSVLIVHVKDIDPHIAFAVMVLPDTDVTIAPFTITWPLDAIET